MTYHLNFQGQADADQSGEFIDCLRCDIDRWKADLDKAERENGGDHARALEAWISAGERRIAEAAH